MNYSSTPLMTTLVMSKSITKPTTHPITNITLVLPLDPVTISKQGRKRSYTRPSRTRIVLMGS